MELISTLGTVLSSLSGGRGGHRAARHTCREALAGVVLHLLTPPALCSERSSFFFFYGAVGFDFETCSFYWSAVERWTPMSSSPLTQLNPYMR